MLFKYLLFIYFKLDIAKLLKDKLNFWDYQKFDRNTTKNTNKIYSIINIIQNSAIITSLSVVLLYYLKPAFNDNETYIIDAWIFTENIIFDVTVLACQYYFFLVITSIVIGYDSIYLSLCTHVVLQVRLLKCKLKQVSEDSCQSAERKIKKCIMHHQLLIS